MENVWAHNGSKVLQACEACLSPTSLPDIGLHITAQPGLTGSCDVKSRI